MLQPFVTVLQYTLFLVLLCSGPVASAQDGSTARGIEAFRETCLMADMRSETIYKWAADRNLKIVQGQGPERAGPKLLTWEVAKSGAVTVLLQAYVNSPASLQCSIYFNEQRDSSKQVEVSFLEEMKRHPTAKQLRPGSGPDSTAYSFTDGNGFYGYFDGRKNDQDTPHILLSVAVPLLARSDIAVPRFFATRERSYQFFVSTCLAHFPDIESIQEYVVGNLGWKSQTVLQTHPPYHNIWSLWDPFDEMGPYSLELIRSNVYKLCALHFDLRAAVPMERLIDSYSLVHLSDPYPNLSRRPDEKIEYYSGLVGGKQAVFRLRTEEPNHDGELGVFVETPQ